jgi:hypothetical protein
MYRAAFMTVAALACVGLVRPVHADTITDDTSLAAPGVYFGTGNANSGFTVDSNGSVEIGLSAIDRYVGPITPSGNVYDAPLGSPPPPNNTGSAWGVDFSVNLQPGNTSGSSTGSVLSSISVTLSYLDTGTGANASGLNLLAIADNTCYGPGGATIAGGCNSSVDWAVQNSEPGDILAALGDPGFSDTTPDIYDFTVSVFGATGALIGSDMIVVNTGVPEPTTLASFGIGLIAIGFFGYRRRKTGSLAA